MRFPEARRHRAQWNKSYMGAPVGRNWDVYIEAYLSIFLIIVGRIGWRERARGDEEFVERISQLLCIDVAPQYFVVTVLHNWEYLRAEGAENRSRKKILIRLPSSGKRTPRSFAGNIPYHVFPTPITQTRLINPNPR